MLLRAADTETMERQDVQAHWREILDRVCRGGTRVLVAQNGAPIAAVIPATDFDRFRRWEAERQEAFRVLERSWAAFADIPEAELEREIEHALRESRAKHRRADAHRPIPSQ